MSLSVPAICKNCFNENPFRPVVKYSGSLTAFVFPTPVTSVRGSKPSIFGYSGNLITDIAVLCRLLIDCMQIIAVEMCDSALPYKFNIRNWCLLFCFKLQD